MNTTSFVNTPSPSALFAQTEEILKFWLGIVENNLPRNQYKQYLESMGWDSRSASPYLRLAKFIQEHFPQGIKQLSRLDIQTLLRLPTKRYLPLIDSLQGKDNIDLVALKGLVKALPTAPKKPQPNKKIEIDSNLLEELTQVTGLTPKEAVEFVCRKVIKVIEDGGQEEEALTCADSAVLVEVAEEYEGQEEDLVPFTPLSLTEEVVEKPEPEPEQQPETRLLLPRPFPVRFRHGENVYAFILEEVEGENAIFGDMRIPFSQIKEIDIKLIKREISDHTKIGYPYHQAFINAAHYKQACVDADNAIEEGSRNRYEKQARDWLFRAANLITEHGIWFDLEELKTNRRLIFVPNSTEDFIVHSAHSPRQPIEKREKQVQSFVESFRNERPQVALSQCLEDALCWDDVATIVGKSNRQLSEAVKGWSDAQKHGLVQMLANHIIESPQAILDGSLDWLNFVSFQRALQQIIFSVRGTKYRLESIIDHKTADELWFMVEMDVSMPEPKFFSRQEIRVESLIGF